MYAHADILTADTEGGRSGTCHCICSRAASISVMQINISVMQFTWDHQRGGNSAEFEWLGVY
jgi:hypothetical protein